MSINNLVKKIQDNLSQDLLKPQFKGHPNKLWGHCYVASEALYHLLGADASYYRPMRIKVNSVNHWFLKNKKTNEILDVTAEQFDFKLDYSKAKNAAFLTKKPSKRCKILIERIQ